jgi:hypothetical protein
MFGSRLARVVLKGRVVQGWSFASAQNISRTDVAGGYRAVDPIEATERTEAIDEASGATPSINSIARNAQVNELGSTSNDDTSVRTNVQSSKTSAGKPNETTSSQCPEAMAQAQLSLCGVLCGMALQRQETIPLRLHEVLWRSASLRVFLYIHA